MDDPVARSPLDQLAPSLGEVAQRTSGRLALTPLARRGQLDLRLGDDGGRSVQLVERALGATLPSEPNRVSCGETTVAWLGPDEWLIFCDPGAVASLEARLRAALDGSWGSVVDVSANRIGLSISGPLAREALMTCCTLDLRPAQFRVDGCAQTLIERAGVLLHRRDDDTFDLWVRPSFARYLALVLLDACAPSFASGHEAERETPVTA